MKPHERRQKLLGWLRDRKTVTADDAARHLGVSLRTLHRDIATLRLDGYPIHGEPGRKGGIRLAADSRSGAIEFEAGEALELVLSARLAEITQAVPMSAPARSAIRKIEETLARSHREGVVGFLERVIVEDAEATESGSIRSRVLPAIAESFRRRKVLRFESEGRTSTVETQFLAYRAPSWVLIGIDLDTEDFAEFRLDDIERPRVLESIDFELRERPG